MTDGHRDDARDAGGTVLGDDLPVRLGALLVLAVAGLGLAGAGIALGLGDSLEDTGDDPEITVSGENITLVTGARERTTVMDMTDVREVEITVTDDEFQIQADRGSQLTHDERERATTIVRNNETVMEVVGEFDDHEVSVQPAGESGDDIDIQLTSGEPAPTHVELEDENVELENEEAEDGDIDLYLASGDENSVTIRRRTTSDGQTVVVTIVDTETGAQQYSLVIDPLGGGSQGPQADAGIEEYSLVVDLVTERVVDMTSERYDW